MIQEAEIKSKSIWNKMPILCLVGILIINSSGDWQYGYFSRLTLILAVLSMSLFSVIMWMRADKKNEILKTDKVFKLVLFSAITLSIGVMMYFLK